jgi:methionyl-tRNA formyltransferase
MTSGHPAHGALRIVYAGTPEFAVPALRRLLDADANVVAVYTQPDRRAGRGRRLTTSPVKQLALEHDLPVHQPESLRDEEARQTLSDLAPDLLVVAAYGLILPEDILAIPIRDCWNIHASLLPRWRGAAPIQRAIETGDHRTGVCIMRMEAGLDTGPVFHCLDTVIEASDTGGSVHDRLATLGADALLTCLGRLERGTLDPPEPQDEGKATYAPKLSKAEAELDFAAPALTLERRIRAFDPWPVAWFMYEGRRLRVWRAAADPRGHDAHPGTVLGVEPKGIELATGQGRLRLLEVQPEGGRRMPVSDFLNARRLR